MKSRRFAVAALIAPLVMAGSFVKAEEQESEFEDFTSAKFSRPTKVDNEWFPLKPGTRYIWDGFDVDEEGDVEAHSVAFYVTDLTKEIAGVQTVVCMDEDYADGQLEEAEIVFFAQDDDGNVWHLGQYPEEYDEGELIATPAWIHGIGDGKAGIMMKANPKLGDSSYSQGLSVSTPWTDRAQVFKVGEQTTVPFGTFEDVLIMHEWDQEEPDARQWKYYARGVGNVRVGWSGEDSSQEVLELISVTQLAESEMVNVRKKALNLDKNAYKHSRVYARTKPIQQPKEKLSDHGLLLD